MKKILSLLVLAAVVVSAQAGVKWSTWDDVKPEGFYKGCEIGLRNYTTESHGAQINAFSSRTDKFENGCQYTLFGYSRATTFKHGAICGAMTRVDELNGGVQVGIYNTAKSSMLQFGLICHNEKGFLPWFPFFNFRTKK